VWSPGLELSSRPLLSVLLVVSEPKYRVTLSALLGALDRLKLIVADTSESGISELYRESIDLVIIDLDGLSPRLGEKIDSEEPLNIINKVREYSSHVSIVCLLSSDVSVARTNSLLAHSHHEDQLASGRTSPNVCLRSKDDHLSIEKDVTCMRDLIERLEVIAINTRGRLVLLDRLHQRLLRTFAVTFRGANCSIERMRDGVSGAQVFKVVVAGEDGGERIHALAKIDSQSKVKLEADNYAKEVSRLPTGNYPPTVGNLTSPNPEASAIFYRLLNDDRPLYKLILGDPEIASRVVGNLSDAMRTWHSDGEMRRTKIADIRRVCLDDDKLLEIVGIYPDLSWFREVEALEIQCRWTVCHGDLHGGNVFVNSAETPILIDFADICFAPCALDPVTLELSLFTHPGTYSELEWLPDTTTPSWPDIKIYTEGSNYRLFISACRDWSYKVAAGDSEVLACAYAYLMKQLKYSDVNHDLIRGLLQSLRPYFEST
jgi:hypothetical protein